MQIFLFFVLKHMVLRLVVNSFVCVFSRRNVLKVTIEVPWAGEVNVYCTQLDHLDENWRMKQIDAITRGDESPHILLGGLNSLDGSDYSTERWNHIVKVKIC